MRDGIEEAVAQRTDSRGPAGVPCVPSRFVVLCTSLKTAKNDLKLGFVFVVQHKINELCSKFSFVDAYSV